MPLAAAVAIVCNHIEIRSDLFKLLFVSRKPWPERVRSIGTCGARPTCAPGTCCAGSDSPSSLRGSWHAVQRTMAWVSVLTNVLLFGLASDQMVVWFPALFHRDNIAVPTFGEGMEVEAEQVAVLGRGRLVVALLWLIEHLVLLACAAIVTAIPSVPGRVRKVRASPPSPPPAIAHAVVPRRNKPAAASSRTRSVVRRAWRPSAAPSPEAGRRGPFHIWVSSPSSVPRRVWLDLHPNYARIKRKASRARRARRASNALQRISSFLFLLEASMRSMRLTRPSISLRRSSSARAPGLGSMGP